MDEFTISNFSHSNFLNIEGSFDYPLPTVSNVDPCSIIFSDDHTTYHPSTISLPPPLPPPRNQSLTLHLEKGDSSHVPKVVTPYISIQDHSTKDDKPNRQHRQSSSSSRKRHNVSERRRRYKVKEKVKMLKDLIPNCDKKDMASVLEEAIKYIRSLKLEAQNMWQHQLLHAQAGLIPVAAPHQCEPIYVWNHGIRPYLYHIQQAPMLQPNQQQLITSNPLLPSNINTISVAAPCENQSLMQRKLQ